MAEWLKAAVRKTDPKGAWVRIPLLIPKYDEA